MEYLIGANLRQNTIWSVIVITIISYLIYALVEDRSDFSISDNSTCPFCYGWDLCDKFGIEINLNASFIRYLLHLLVNRKNIRKTNYGDLKVVLKKLASDGELNDFDKMTKTLNTIDEDVIYKKIISALNENESISLFKLCPYPEKNLKFLLELSDAKNKFQMEVLWTILYINPEPIILKIFEAEVGWPVPRYYGSCGRTIVVEDCGTSLRHFYDSDWLLRMHFAQQLLQLAELFTNHHEKFAVYFADLTADNVAVDNLFNVKIVDLENVILVDKQHTVNGTLGAWEDTHQSDHFECDECFTYSADEVCSHRISDHNIYAVCKEFFDASAYTRYGLLHSLPDRIVSKYKVYENTESCVKNNLDVGNRFAIARELITLFQLIKDEENFQTNFHK